jgi:predicted DNA-binding ribbon-helix-helix protein
LQSRGLCSRRRATVTSWSAGPPRDAAWRRRSAGVKHTVSINGRKISISLEEAFWRGLKDIAQERHQTLGHLITSIDADWKQSNLSSTIRIFILEFYKEQVAWREQQETARR